MAEQRTAAQIAEYDQAQAGASAEIDRLVAIARSLAAEVGGDRALADVGALLAPLEDIAEVKGLLTAAIGQLAGLERKDEVGNGPGDPSSGTG